MNDPMVSVADAMAERHAKLLDEALRIYGAGKNDPVQAFAMQRDDEGFKYYLGGKLILAISHLELCSSQFGGRLVSSCNLYPPEPQSIQFP